LNSAPNRPDHDDALLRSVLEQASEIGERSRADGRRPVLLGCDVHAGALSLARRAATAAGVENLIEFSQARPISHWFPYDRVGVVNADP
jgi:23S rRNA G2445 N2-methylase RlmL